MKTLNIQPTSVEKIFIRKILEGLIDLGDKEMLKDFKKHEKKIKHKTTKFIDMIEKAHKDAAKSKLKFD